MRALVLAAVLAVLAATGCGGFGSNAAKREISEADQRWAEASALAASDLGGGWGASGPQRIEQADECPDVDLSDLTVTGEAQALYEEAETGRVIVSVRTVFPTAGEARDSVARGSSDELEECLSEGAAEGAASEETSEFQLADARTEEVEPVAAGELARAFELTHEYVLGDGTRISSTVELVVFQRGRAVVALGFVGVGEPFLDSLTARLVRAADERVEREPPP